MRACFKTHINALGFSPVPLRFIKQTTTPAKEAFSSGRREKPLEGCAPTYAEIGGKDLLNSPPLAPKSRLRKHKPCAGAAGKGYPLNAAAALQPKLAPFTLPSLAARCLPEA